MPDEMMQEMRLVALLEDIRKVEEKFHDPAFPDYAEKFQGWRQEVLDAMMNNSLRQHPGIIKAVRELQAEIQKINNQLISDPLMPLFERYSVIRDKLAYEFLISLIWPYPERLDSIAKEVANELEEEQVEVVSSR